MPDPGEGLVEAEIVTWRVAVGDVVKVNDILVEIETAKSLVELPSPFAGTVTALLADEGQMVDVGAPIVAVSDGADEPVPSPAVALGSDHVATVPEGGAEAGDGRVANLVGYGPRSTEARRRPRKGAPEHASAPAAAAPAPAAPAAPAPAAPTPARAAAQVPATAPVTGNSLPAEPQSPAREDAPFLGGGPAVLAKPPVRKLAKDRGVDLTALTGSGPGGVITREDVERAAQPAAAPAASAPAAPAPVRPVVPAAPARQGDPERETRVPIKGVRKATADAMVRSAFTAPHVTEWVTCDVTATMDLVERLRDRREFRGVKISPLLVVAKAVCVALSRVPQLNAYWDEAAQEIATLHYVNLGIAAATPRGLVVPNLKGADAMTLLEMAQAINAVVSTARDGRTSPSDMAGGTFTITNVGTFGVDAGTPIVNPGEAGILCVGQIARRPWVVGAGRDERIEPRWVTTLAVSFDHRLVDGEQGSVFLSTVAQILTDPGLGLLF
ncbi:dihydrolipoamide acetyltransferase family protein [Microlunatus spumicola]|uniref:dihydrolipoamide acetyltransferase family protein n=1 Tax=Microlunatus spumicola TaxID=81499 RepID=UPI003CD08B13